MILPARRPSSPPNPRGISTSQRSFLAAHRPPRPHGKDERLRESERRWRWPVVWLAVALAACSAPLGLGTQLSPDAAQPLANASTAPTLLPSAPPPGRAVATMPSSRLGTDSIQPTLLHGAELPPAALRQATRRIPRRHAAAQGRQFQREAASGPRSDRRGAPRGLPAPLRRRERHSAG